jgi:hypothetical protein
LKAVLSKAELPWPFVIVNELSENSVFAQQTFAHLPIWIFLNSTSFFGFNAPFSEPAIMLTVAGISQLIPLQYEIRGSRLPFQVGGARLSVDLVTLASGIRALVVGEEAFVLPEIKYSAQISCEQVVASFFDQNLAEFLLVTLEFLDFSLTPGEVTFQLIECKSKIKRCPRRSALLRGTSQRCFCSS